MTGDLHGILLRFREGKVAAQGDIRKMYYGVRVTKEEEYMQLYMWRFKGEESIKVFAMCRLVMGNKPSANCSQIALRETALLNDNATKYPAAAKALTSNSYVDNTFTTANSLSDLQKNIQDIQKKLVLSTIVASYTIRVFLASIVTLRSVSLALIVLQKNPFVGIKRSIMDLLSRANTIRLK